MRVVVSMALMAAGLAACAAKPAGWSKEPATLGPDGPAASRGQVGGDLEHHIRRFDEDRGSLSSFYNLRWSESRFDRLERFHREELERLRGVEFGTLSSQGQIDYVLLRNRITATLEDLERDRGRVVAMERALPARRLVAGLEEARWRMEAVDPNSAAEAVAKIPEIVSKSRRLVEEGRKGDPPSEETLAGLAEEDRPVIMTRPEAGRAAGIVSETRRALQSWYDFHAGYEPTFAWWVRKPYEAAVKSLDEYSRWLRDEVGGGRGGDDAPLIGDPIGREHLRSDLAEEVLAYSPEELIAIGEKEFAWCEEQMRLASAELGFGEDWKAALAHVKSLHVPPGGQDDLVARQSREAIQWLKDRDLITIPPLCEETWRLSMISPETQRVLPFAAYGGQNMMVAYPTDEMSHDDKMMSMRGNNEHFTRIVTPHELIPGHHLQRYMAERERAYRGMFSTPFFVEGWALYWELTMWEMGYPRGPEDRIGMLFWRMHRCARIIVSLRFHLGEMTPQEMIDFLVDRVGHERYGATSEVRRYIGGQYSPLYQCGYMIGGLQLRALRREVVDTGRMTDREFHDALLTFGAIPIELIRSALTDAELSPEGGAAWRFEVSE